MSNDEPVYFASHDAPPASERRAFIIDTRVVFSCIQEYIVKEAKSKEMSWLQSNETQEVLRKFSFDYLRHLEYYWVHASQPIERPDGPLQFSSGHYRSLFSCFTLFVLLYMPQYGYEKAPVGEELMEWLNIHFIEPSTEEGDHLSSLDSPWEDESFWPYLTRTILRGLSKASLFFLKTLLKHPSDDLQELVQTLISLVETQPRLQNFQTERDFANASRRWKDKVKALRVEMDRVPENLRFDETENWWDSLSDIVGILEGRGDHIQRVCAELGADWKEVCCAWGVFVDTRLRREELPDVVGEVIDEMPSDPTNLEDMIHAALFSGQPEQALKHASQLDPWLAAHMADIMVLLDLLDSEVNSESELSKRDEYLLSYAEYVHADPTLWRETVSYMYSCADIGKERGDTVLMRVPLRQRSSETADNLSEIIKEINAICFEHQREYVRRAVCRIAGQTLARQRDYGLAVTYHISAEDWSGLGRVIDRVLEEYIQNGPVSFTSHAAKFVHSLQELPLRTNAEGIFAHRLTFAVRYAQIHRLRAEQDVHGAASDIVTLLRDEIAPKSWWAILLCDTVDLLQHGATSLFSQSDIVVLLRKLEEITIRTAQGSGEDYLSILVRTIKGGGEKDALDRLKIVRLALAKYFAQCSIAGSDKSGIFNH
ncbi:hypothetical protein Moror_14153 [Moniliophthora roreri MCA 2997]|uniref:Nuclear pore complex protein Nup85 n=1 Tax=Moniliophthora roreri (strain MCA 2997) TaxID=1381753 RepID=V2YT44_MONRO|nr:hypothetical protein Moror_14153 [Moniliophthora roreri MCA 2997]